MKLFDWIKKKVGLEEEEDDEFFLSGLKLSEDSESMDDVLNSSTMKRENLDVSDYRERERFVSIFWTWVSYLVLRLLLSNTHRWVIRSRS